MGSLSVDNIKAAKNAQGSDSRSFVEIKSDKRKRESSNVITNMTLGTTIRNPGKKKDKEERRKAKKALRAKKRKG